jgi:hypothetical protein
MASKYTKLTGGGEAEAGPAVAPRADEHEASLAHNVHTPDAAIARAPSTPSTPSARRAVPPTAPPPSSSSPSSSPSSLATTAAPTSTATPTTSRPPVARAPSVADELCCLYCTEPECHEGLGGFLPHSPCFCQGELAAIHTECFRADMVRNWRLNCSVCKAPLRYEREVFEHAVGERLSFALRSWRLRLALGCALLAWCALHVLAWQAANEYRALTRSGQATHAARSHAAAIIGWSGFARSLLATSGLVTTCVAFSHAPFRTVRVQLLAAAAGGATAACAHAEPAAAGLAVALAAAAGGAAAAVVAPRVVLLELEYKLSATVRSRAEVPRELIAFDRAMRRQGKVDAVLQRALGGAAVAAGADADAEAADVEMGDVRRTGGAEANARGAGAGVEPARPPQRDRPVPEL